MLIIQRYKTIVIINDMMIIKKHQPYHDSHEKD